MDSQDIRQCINDIEQATDEAKRATQSGPVAEPLRQCVEAMHQQARQAKQQMGSSPDEQGQRQIVTQLEEAADQALQACRTSGTTVQPQLQQAIQRVHDEAKKLKKKLEAGSTA